MHEVLITGRQRASVIGVVIGVGGAGGGAR
jgi:hypothetical protein